MQCDEERYDFLCVIPWGPVKVTTQDIFGFVWKNNVFIFLIISKITSSEKFGISLDYEYRQKSTLTLTIYFCGIGININHGYCLKCET